MKTNIVLERREFLMRTGGLLLLASGTFHGCCGVSNPSGSPTTAQFFTDTKNVGVLDGQPVFRIAMIQNVKSDFATSRAVELYNIMYWGTRDSSGNVNKIVQAAVWQNQNINQATHAWFDGLGRPIATKGVNTSEYMAFTWDSSQVTLHLFDSTNSEVLRSIMTPDSRNIYSVTSIPLSGRALTPEANIHSLVAFPIKLSGESKKLTVGGVRSRQEPDCGSAKAGYFRNVLQGYTGLPKWFLAGVRDGIKIGTPVALLFATAATAPFAIPFASVIIGASILMHYNEGVQEDLLPPQTVGVTCVADTADTSPTDPDLPHPVDIPVPPPIPAPTATPMPTPTPAPTPTPTPTPEARYIVHASSWRGTRTWRPPAGPSYPFGFSFRIQLWSDNVAESDYGSPGTWGGGNGSYSFETGGKSDDQLFLKGNIASENTFVGTSGFTPLGNGTLGTDHEVTSIGDLDVKRY